MPDRKKYPKMLIYIVAAMLILGTLAILVVNQANISRSRLPVYGTLTDFEFINAATGQPFGLKQMIGKINVVDFIFTNCKTACPVMAENMGDLYALYKGSELVQFVSISVDPARDSLDVLRQYAEEHGVDDDRWVFLWAPLDNVVNLCENQFMLAADELPMGHTTKFILVDRQGRIRSYHEGLEAESMGALEDNIRQLARQSP
jgi:protein SCO1/2